MKITHIITGLDTGGAERALYSLLLGGLAKNYDCCVISLSNEGVIGPKIKALGVPVVTLDMKNRRPSFLGLVKLSRSIRAFQPDLIQGWMYHGNFAAKLACAMALQRPTLIWNIRQTLYDLSYEKPMTRQVIRANRFFSSAPDALLYNSHISRKQHEAFGFSPEKGQIIPNGIDVNRFSFSSSSRHGMRSLLGIPEDDLVVGHVARLHPMKDHPLFLKAAADISLRYPRTHFILCGRDVSLQNKDLKQFVPQSAHDRFHFLGERRDVSSLMCALDIFCLSSAWGESFPNVIGEAMAMGLPCVATDVGDTSMIIGETGIVVSPQNKNSLIAAIERLLTMPIDKLRMLGLDAKDKIHAEYTLVAIVDQYIALYEKLMTNKKCVGYV